MFHKWHSVFVVLVTFFFLHRLGRPVVSVCLGSCCGAVGAWCLQSPVIACSPIRGRCENIISPPQQVVIVPFAWGSRVLFCEVFKDMLCPRAHQTILMKDGSESRFVVWRRAAFCCLLQPHWGYRPGKCDNSLWTCDVRRSRPSAKGVRRKRHFEGQFSGRAFVTVCCVPPDLHLQRPSVHRRTSACCATCFSPRCSFPPFLIGLVVAVVAAIIVIIHAIVTWNHDPALFRTMCLHLGLPVVARKRSWLPLPFVVERERECVLIYCVVLDFTSFYGKRRPAPVDMREWCVCVRCVCLVSCLL